MTIKSKPVFSSSHLITFFTCLLCFFLFYSHPLAAETPQGFVDHFDSGINPERWIVINKQWGGDNGGVSSQNIHWVNAPDHPLELWAQGDLYQGPPKGAKGQTIRVGSALATREYYASGEYAVCAKLPPDIGVASAFWLFHYLELSPDDPDFISGKSPIRNSEIDWELPTHPDINTPISYRYAKTNAWGGKKPGEDDYFTAIVDLAPFNQGKDPAQDEHYHLYEIRWRSGNTLPNRKVQPGSIEWLFASDCNQPAQLVKHLSGKTGTKDDIPYRAARFWIGLWFPVSKTPYENKYTGWAGTPHFKETQLLIRWVRIAPYTGQYNYDVWVPET